MSMELTPNDKKVVDLLSKLKNSGGTYPPDILAARREAYLKQMASVGLGMGLGIGLKNAAKGGSNGGGMIATASSKILEIVLVAAIAIEAGTAAYLYRDKIADLIKTYRNSSNVQEVVPATKDTATTAPELIEIVESPSATALTPSGTPHLSLQEALTIMAQVQASMPHLIRTTTMATNMGLRQNLSEPRTITMTVGTTIMAAATAIITGRSQ